MYFNEEQIWRCQVFDRTSSHHISLGIKFCKQRAECLLSSHKTTIQQIKQATPTNVSKQTTNMILRPRLASPKRYTLYSSKNKTAVSSSEMVLRPREAYRLRNSPVKKRRMHTKHTSSAKAFSRKPRELAFLTTPSLPDQTAIQNPTPQGAQTPQQQHGNNLALLDPLAMANSLHENDQTYIGDDEVFSFVFTKSCTFEEAADAHAIEVGIAEMKFNEYGKYASP